MAALGATVPTAVGVAYAGAAVAASDTIAAAHLGTRGAHLVIINGGGSTDNVEVSDASLSQAGNPADTTAVAVAAGTAKAIYISPRAVDPVTGLVTVTNSFITTVTYVLLPLG